MHGPAFAHNDSGTSQGTRLWQPPMFRSQDCEIEWVSGKRVARGGLRVGRFFGHMSILEYCIAHSSRAVNEGSFSPATGQLVNLLQHSKFAFSNVIMSRPGVLVL